MSDFFIEQLKKELSQTQIQGAEKSPLEKLNK